MSFPLLLTAAALAQQPTERIPEAGVCVRYDLRLHDSLLKTEGAITDVLAGRASACDAEDHSLVVKLRGNTGIVERGVSVNEDTGEERIFYASGASSWDNPAPVALVSNMHCRPEPIRVYSQMTQEELSTSIGTALDGMKACLAEWATPTQ